MDGPSKEEHTLTAALEWWNAASGETLTKERHVYDFVEILQYLLL